MSNLVRGQPHQNIIMKCSMLTSQIVDPIDKYADGMYVLCDKITDPQNLGAVIRSCLFYGVKTIFLNKKNSCPLNPTVSKASAGALELMPVHSIPK